MSILIIGSISDAVDSMSIYYIVTMNSTVLTWPLHDIAIANIVWCIAYTGGVGVVRVTVRVNPGGGQ